MKRGREGRARARHPWVYGGEIDAVVGAPEAGDIVEVVDHRKGFLGRGFINPASNITVRILSWDEGEAVDEAFFRKRLARALEYRKAVAGDAACCRLVFSDGDFLSSLVVDRYHDVCVIQTAALGMDVRKGMIAGILTDLLGAPGIYERNDARSRELEGLKLRSGFLVGEFPTAFWAEENGYSFWVDVERGQKTGLYLDQRENHRAIAPWCEGARVLDAFCYTGGFAIHAAGYGAREVIGLDSSGVALEAAKLAAERNGLGDRIALQEGNAFDVLRQLAADGERFDLVIVDPPAFAPSKRTIDAAYRGYKEINLRAMKLLGPGGILVSCSCSYHMAPEVFLKMLEEAAIDARRAVRLVELRTQAKDHPILLGVQETHYLKCAILRMD